MTYWIFSTISKFFMHKLLTNLFSWAPVHWINIGLVFFANDAIWLRNESSHIKIWHQPLWKSWVLLSLNVVNTFCYLRRKSIGQCSYNHTWNISPVPTCQHFYPGWLRTLWRLAQVTVGFFPCVWPIKVTTLAHRLLFWMLVMKYCKNSSLRHKTKVQWSQL